MVSKKKYRTISEVSILLKINTHVIRYWDSKFDGISTRLGKNKQRFFNFDNIKKIKELQATLYNNGKHNYSLELANKIIEKKSPLFLKNIQLNKKPDYNNLIEELNKIKNNLQKIIE